MSPEREILWRERIRQGHWPYRRDCRVCAEAAASGKPARKVVHRDAYVLSMDTAGPFREKGMDENGEKCKYVLGLTYFFPKTFAAAAEAEIPDEVEDFEMDEYVPSEAEQEEEGESGELSKEEAKREEEWNKLLGDLTKPMEWSTLRFAIPLKGILKAGSGDHGGHPGRVCLLEGKWFPCSQVAFPQSKRVSDKGLASLVFGTRYLPNVHRGIQAGAEWGGRVQHQMAQGKGKVTAESSGHGCEVLAECHAAGVCALQCSTTATSLCTHRLRSQCDGEGKEANFGSF